jgi:transcriptional regulator GlxA family with amidase domain
VNCNSSEEKKESTSEAKKQTEKQFPKLESNHYNVAFLIMEGVYNTELTAPYDIFQHTKFRKNIKAMNVFTVANTNDAITTFEGMRILPDFNYITDSLPKIDILVVPSAEHHLDTDLEDTAIPNLDIRKDVLFVHDGKYITSAGGAKSFEAALYLSEHLYGKEIAKSLAGGLVIDWDLNKVPHVIIE